MKSGGNDTAALREVLLRRFAHEEWPYPNLIVTDGGVAQKNIADSVVKHFGKKIPIVGIVKNIRHRPDRLLGDRKNIEDHRDAILIANNEAHRFAVQYHRTLRRRGVK